MTFRTLWHSSVGSQEKSLLYIEFKKALIKSQKDPMIARIAKDVFSNMEEYYPHIYLETLAIVFLDRVATHRLPENQRTRKEEQRINHLASLAFSKEEISHPLIENSSMLATLSKTVSLIKAKYS